MSLVLHYHPLSSYCWKVLIALYEKGLAFEAREVNMGDPDARAAYAELWPTGKIPLLQDGDRVVPETTIQIEYLDLHHPAQAQLLPGDAAAQLEVRLWDRLFDGYVMGGLDLAIGHYHLRPEGQRDPLGLENAERTLAMAYAMIEARMPGSTWAVGERFTLADCAAAPALFYTSIVKPFPETCPRLAAYFERLMARPSVARCIAEARPYFQYFPLVAQMPARFRDAG
ncbi:MAG: glutathione S-transferase family protein [Phenylobacterium sp.]|nr:glutathione S-transferase family protein [Phenylobacterium sp.]